MPQGLHVPLHPVWTVSLQARSQPRCLSFPDLRIESVHGEISHNIEQHIEAQKVRAEAEKQAQKWQDAIALQEDMSKWVRTPDFDFVPEDVVSDEILSPRMR